MRIDSQALTVIRERRGLSLKELADAVGSSRGYLHDLEHGRRGGSPGKIKKLAEALGVPTAALIDLDGHL